MVFHLFFCVQSWIFFCLVDCLRFYLFACLFICLSICWFAYLLACFCLFPCLFFKLFVLLCFFVSLFIFCFLVSCFCLCVAPLLNQLHLKYIHWHQKQQHSIMWISRCHFPETNCSAHSRTEFGSICQIHEFDVTWVPSIWCHMSSTYFHLFRIWTGHSFLVWGWALCICVFLVPHITDCSLRPTNWARRADTDGQKWTRFDSDGSIGGI